MLLQHAVMLTLVTSTTFGALLTRVVIVLSASECIYAPYWFLLTFGVGTSAMREVTFQEKRSCALDSNAKLCT